MIRTYSELIQLPNFVQRFRYLALSGVVGEETFGWERWINQDFYRSREWKMARSEVIARDYGRDLAAVGHDIHDRVYVHHMNPMTSDQIIHGIEDIINPEYLITTCHRTHNAIHYGDESLLPRPLTVRTPGDTKLW